MLIAQFLCQKKRTLNRPNIFSSNQWYHTAQMVKFIIIHINVTCGLPIHTPHDHQFHFDHFLATIASSRKKPNKQNKADKNHSFTRKMKFMLQTAAAAAATPLVSSKRNETHCFQLQSQSKLFFANTCATLQLSSFSSPSLSCFSQPRASQIRFSLHRPSLDTSVTFHRRQVNSQVDRSFYPTYID